MNSKYNLVVCELFNPYIHGSDDNNNKYVNGHYLCAHISRNRSIFEERLYDSDSEDEDNDDYEPHIYDIIELYRAYYYNFSRNIYNSSYSYPYIRNYKKITASNNYIVPHIGEVMYLPSGECVVIIKTFWIRLIQRAWKRVFHIRKNAILKRKRLNSQHFRDIYGKWPVDCNYLPSIYGLIKC
jgi:hypothetical protein